MFEAHGCCPLHGQVRSAARLAGQPSRVASGLSSSVPNTRIYSYQRACINASTRCSNACRRETTAETCATWPDGWPRVTSCWSHPMRRVKGRKMKREASMAGRGFRTITFTGTFRPSSTTATITAASATACDIVRNMIPAILQQQASSAECGEEWKFRTI